MVHNSPHRDHSDLGGSWAPIIVLQQDDPVAQTKEALLRRLDDIAASLADSGSGLALLGLGSAGRDLDRMDAYSDLDFFAIVVPGHKADYLDDLGWLSAAAPIAYAYRNTRDGHKVLFRDEVFCEMAVFEPDELAAIPYAPGRIVWAKDGFPPELLVPGTGAAVHPPPPPDLEWLVGELLSHLYVGLSRARRGEHIAGFRSVQLQALDRLLEIAARLAPGSDPALDPFAHERRVEARLPDLAPHLPSMTRGSGHTPEAALAMLAWLEARTPVNGAMASAIRRLATP